MQLPENASAFSESAIAASRRLIELGLWEVRMARLESWLNQFYGEEAVFFSACLLDQIIFRTSQQFEAGLRSLFRSNINGRLFQNQPDLSLLHALSGRNDPKLRLVPVIGESDPPTKSGTLVLRRLQRILHLKSHWTCWPWQAAEQVAKHEVNGIIFVDDFLGSGRQFEKFFKQWGFPDLLDKAAFTYAPVTAHKEGINHLAKELPNIAVEAAEVLDASHSFFSKEVWDRLGQGCVSCDDAKQWYAAFAEERGLTPKRIGLLGVGDLALTFGFSHSTPNNSLPILWYEAAGGWQPLLER